jgi:ATP-binding cassette subfamily D (ALD) long-chain fatty acid import protein
MAAQSKLALPGAPSERTIRNIISDLTSLYLQNRSRISKAVWITLFVALANRIRHAIAEQKAASQREASQRSSRRGVTSTTDDVDGTTKRKKVELNREFFRSLMRLLRIVVPGWRSQETRLLISHSFFLVIRTLISLKVAAMDGQIVKSLVKGNGKEFLTRIVWWMLIAVPATFTNSMVSGVMALSLAAHTDMLAVGIPSSRTVSQVPNTPDATYPRQVPVTTHLLRHLRTG